MSATIAPHDLNRLLVAEHDDPFSILGLHKVGFQLVLRAFRPEASSLAVLDRQDPSRRFAADRVAKEGFFEAVIGEDAPRFDYLLEVTTWKGETVQFADPYSFGPILGELDMLLLKEGNHFKIYEKLGAHLVSINGCAGVSFAVWAPKAQRVSVVGDFNGWDGRIHPMRHRMEAGVWEIFVPGVCEGAHYKFEICNCFGQNVLKSDPFAFYGQHSLKTASLVFDLDRFGWSDQAWMEARERKQWQREPVSVYEVHLGSWARVPEENNRYLSYTELADRLIPYVKEMGYTHIELLPVSEHPFDGSWGYQVTGYYAATSRFGNPDEFRNFVERCHENQLGIILDFVPGHFPKDASGLAEFDGTHLYEHADPRQGEQKDWGTLVFNCGRNEVRSFLIGNALFWLDRFHIDGLRVDAVASMLYLDYSRKPGEWVPNAFGGRENLEAIYFLKRLNEICYERFPGIMTIAEESTAWPGVSHPTYVGGLGFGFKWNMGWMHDSLLYMSRDPIFRKYHQGDATFSLIYAFQEHFVLVLSHDEVVHGKRSMISKMPGDSWQKFANLRMFYCWMYAHPGKKLLFMGGEFGQWQEWNYDRSLDWHLPDIPMHAGLRRLVQHLNYLYKIEPAFWDLDDSPDGFEWIDRHDSENCVLAFVRKARSGAPLVFVVNATPMPHALYRIGVPAEGWYQEILNSDAEIYGGTNTGNYGGVHSQPVPWQGRNHSIVITLPPLATLGFKRHMYDEAEKTESRSAEESRIPLG